MKLYEIAHSRAGDKGNLSTISVICYNPADYPKIAHVLTEEYIVQHFAATGVTAVKRYEVPTLSALNFVLQNTLGGGVTRSLALDAHGKSLSGLMLEIDLPEE